MKTLSLRRFAVAMLLLLVSVFLLPSVGVAALALPALALLNYHAAPLVLGMAYPNINTTTVGNLETDTDKAREQIWAESVVDSSNAHYQDAPLAQGGFMGKMGGSRKPNPKVLRKAIVEITDTTKVAGNTINLSTRAGLGGHGVQGEGTRDGTEEKIHVNNYQLKIGRYFFATAYTSIARDESFQGALFDKWLHNELTYLHAKKKNDDHLMRLRAATESGVGLLNVILPDGIASEATLKTANVFDTNLITQMAEYAPSLGCEPMDTTDDSGGSVGELFCFFAPDRILSPLGGEPAYLDALKNADVRGDENAVFKGGFKMWNGHGIYRWIQRHHANRGPIGSPLLPIARLGLALTGANTNSIIHGGGLISGATQDITNADATNTGDTTDGPAPYWFEFFRNSPYAYYNGDTIAADTSTDRYLLIINSDGTGYACYNYRVTNGKAIIIRGRVSIGVGTETNTHPRNSLIVQCNVIGVPVGYPLLLGASALVCGNGRINGAVSATGKVILSNKNYEMDLGIGVEGVWGNQVVARAGDGLHPNYVMSRVAVPFQGAPIIP